VVCRASAISKGKTAGLSKSWKILLGMDSPLNAFLPRLIESY
jgi:hypothetical protein